MVGDLRGTGHELPTGARRAALRLGLGQRLRDPLTVALLGETLIRTAEERDEREDTSDEQPHLDISFQTGPDRAGGSPLDRRDRTAGRECPQ